MDTPTITLFCSILEVSGSLFPVDIEESKTVGHLKKAIVKEKPHTFLQVNVDPDGLKIWKLNEARPAASVDDFLERLRLNPADLTTFAKELHTMSKLSTTFSEGEPEEGHLHIIVSCPMPDASTNSSTHLRQRNPKRAHNDEHRARIFKRRRLDFLEGSETIYQSALDDAQNFNLPSNANFDHLLTTPGMLAADKTMYIELLDRSSLYQYMFLRPRRWGKSTFLQTLADYYDKNKADSFEETFGQLYIGKHPTTSRSSLLVLLFDFSLIETSDHLRESFHRTLNRFLRTFLVDNARFLGYPDPSIVIQDGDAAESMARVFSLVQAHGEMLFVGVDEVDAIARKFLCHTHTSDAIGVRVSNMRRWYNGYIFCPYADGSTNLDPLFNPQLVFTHLRALSEKVLWLSPDKDADALPSAFMLAAITGHGTSSDLLPLLRGDLDVNIKYDFGPDEVRYSGQNLSLTWSLLFHLGVVTHSADRAFLRIPNASVRRLVIERLLNYLRHHDKNFMQMTEHCSVFTRDSFPRFITHLERFFQSRPIRSILDSKEASLSNSSGMRVEVPYRKCGFLPPLANRKARVAFALWTFSWLRQHDSLLTAQRSSTEKHQPSGTMEGDKTECS